MNEKSEAQQVILIYNGDSGLMEALAHAAKKLRGIEECDLCEITYSAMGKRSSWTECARNIPVPIEELHRNEVPPAWGLRQLPCVVLARDGELLSILLDAKAIRACNRDPQTLSERIRQALDPEA